jgi:molecular chaperone DnaK
MGKIIGIDLGTTNSCVAFAVEGSAQIIPNDLGGRTTPSIVAFSDPKSRLIGQLAKRQSVTNARNTIYAVKRIMGRRYDSEEVQLLKSNLPYELVASERGDVRIRVFNKLLSPPEISALLLRHLKSSAEAFLGEPVTEAVITVPAYFDDAQRQATRDAGRIAGLEVRRIINEPTAAALAYGLGKGLAEKIVVYDLGGGTFDVSILELNDGVYEVLATCGDSFLGGEDFDQKIIDWMVHEFLTENGIDLRVDVLAMQRLKETAEKAKCDLSTSMSTHINIPFISSGASGALHFCRVLTRDHFNQFIEPLLERTVGPCLSALKDAKLSLSQVNKVILVGGQTRTPAVQERVREIFGLDPSSEINPDEVVAIGAALQGGVLKGEVKDIILLDVTPLSLGVETKGGLFTKLILRNSTVPLKKSAVFTTVIDNQSTVEIHVLQGEREIAKHNRSLARLQLIGIAPQTRGTPQIEVAFDIDVNGILHVSAMDEKSQMKQEIIVTPSAGLSSEEIEAVIEEAKRLQEADSQEKEITLLKNRADDLAASVRKSYSEFGWMLDAPSQEQIKNALLAPSRSISQERDVSPVIALHEALSELEAAAEVLSRAIFSIPDVAASPKVDAAQENKPAGEDSEKGTS